MRKNFRIPARYCAFLILFLTSLGTIYAATGPGVWSLQSPDGLCSISVTLDEGRLSYQVDRAGQTVLPASPLGLRRGDADFSTNLAFDHAAKPRTQREKYELFTGPQPHINHLVNFRTLTFRNTNGVPLALD